MLRSNSNQKCSGVSCHMILQKLTAAPTYTEPITSRMNNVSQGMYQENKMHVPKKFGSIRLKVGSIIMDPIFLRTRKYHHQEMFLVLQSYAHGLAKDAVLKVASDALCKALVSAAGDDMDMCLCGRRHTKMQRLLTVRGEEIHQDFKDIILG